MRSLISVKTILRGLTEDFHVKDNDLCAICALEWNFFHKFSNLYARLLHTKLRKPYAVVRDLQILKVSAILTQQNCFCLFVKH